MSMEHFPILFDELGILTMAYQKTPDILKDPEYQKDLMNKIVQILRHFEVDISALEVDNRHIWKALENFENRITTLEGKK